MKRLRLLFNTISWILIAFLIVLTYTKVRYIVRKANENTDVVSQEFKIRKVDFYKTIKVETIPEVKDDEKKEEVNDVVVKDKTQEENKNVVETKENTKQPEKKVVAQNNKKDVVASKPTSKNNNVKQAPKQITKPQTTANSTKQAQTVKNNARNKTDNKVNNSKKSQTDKEIDNIIKSKKKGA